MTRDKERASTVQHEFLSDFFADFTVRRHVAFGSKVILIFFGVQPTATRRKVTVSGAGRMAR